VPSSLKIQFPEQIDQINRRGIVERYIFVR